jgi:excisionase family DNA binding protein
MTDLQSREVLNVQEAAEFLGFAPYTIRQKARMGQIPGRKIGGEWRFSKRALLEWLSGPRANFEAPADTPMPTGSPRVEGVVQRR